MFSRRSSKPSPNAAAFKGRSGAELVVKSRGALPRAEGRAVPPRVDGAGVCLVPTGNGPRPGGEAARRGCLVAADSSGFVTGLLLPSLCPIFRDRLPASGDVAGLRGGAAPAQQSVCNLVGELTHLGMAGVSNLVAWLWLGCLSVTGGSDLSAVKNALQFDIGTAPAPGQHLVHLPFFLFWFGLS